MSPDFAVREVLRIERRIGSLAQRTIGMTWMIWAFVNAGVFVTYDAIGFAQPSGTTATLGYGLAWFPWVLLGILTTSVLWRSLLELDLPSEATGTPWVPRIAIVTFLALVLGGLAVITLAKIPFPAPSWVMFAVGAAAVVIGGSGLTTRNRSERTLWIGGGVALAALAAGIVLIASLVAYNPLGLLLILGPVATTSLLFGGGLYTASR